MITMQREKGLARILSKTGLLYLRICLLIHTERAIRRLMEDRVKFQTLPILWSTTGGCGVLAVSSSRNPSQFPSKLDAFLTKYGQNYTDSYLHLLPRICECFSAIPPDLSKLFAAYCRNLAGTAIHFLAPA